jgi:hypothetical protein
MNVRIPESYYSHSLELVPPVYRLFADWTATASLIYERFSGYTTPDDIRWDTTQQRVSDHSITCFLQGSLSSTLRFRPMKVELFLTTGGEVPSLNVPALIEDALSILHSLEPKLRVSSQRVSVGAHVGLIDGTYQSLLQRFVTPPDGTPQLVPQSLALEFDLENGLRGSMTLERSLKYTDPEFLFGMVACNWAGDVSVRHAYERSLAVAVERAKDLGLERARHGCAEENAIQSGAR